MVFEPLLDLQASHITDDGDNNDSKDIDLPVFSCHHMGSTIELHTHAFSELVLYHIGWETFTSKGSHNVQLTPDETEYWNTFTKLAAKRAIAKLPKITIPGGKEFK